MDVAESRPTMRITTGLGSVGVAALVAGRPSPFFHCFLSHTPTTVCWRAVRDCDGALWSAIPGKKPRLHSKTRIACPILPRFAAGPTDWIAPNQLFPFRSEEHTSELQSHSDLVCRLLLEKK